MCVISVQSVYYSVIRIHLVNTQFFIIAYLKQLHVSAVLGSQHQALCFRNVKRKLSSCSCTSKSKNLWPRCRSYMKYS